MAEVDLGFSDEELSRVRDTYATCVGLVDSRLEIYDPERDDIAEAVQRAMGIFSTTSTVETVRYNLVEQPSVGTLPKPYSAVLEKASVVAFQKIEPEEDASPNGSSYRKIELLDPFKAIGGVTLLMIGLEDQERNNPELPAALAHGEEIDWMAAQPFYNPDLTTNLMHLAETIRGLSDAGKLVPISINDVQSMYKLQNQLENQ